MRKCLAAAVVSLCACSPEDFARIDAPLGEELSELSHTVGVRFERGAVLLKVTRQLRNQSAEHQQLERTIALPAGAIATSLRIGADDRWHAETLLSAEEASERWSTLISAGPAAPSTIGMLRWEEDHTLALELFGVAPQATITVEYDLEVPPVSEAGGWQVDYPSEQPPEFRLGAAPGATVEPVEGEESFRLRLTRPQMDRVEAKWATYPLGTDRTLWRLELDAAPRLEPAPLRPNVVFVLDASHSEGPDGIAAQLELLPGYLANVPDARVEVVLVRRFAERLFGRFVPAADVARLLAGTAAHKLAPANGSNLGLGARVAAEALGQEAGLGRIILFTDEQLREGFSNDEVIAELGRAPRDTVTHVVARRTTSGMLEEERNDHAQLASIAAATGGVFFSVWGHPEDPVVAAATLLPLVRPTRIDGFAIEALGMPGDALDVDSKLLEGSTLRQMAIGETAPAQLTLSGKIWAREFRQVVTLDGNLSARMPGLAVGDDEVRAQLEDDELRTAAFASRAVSPVTTWFSAVPDAAPSTAGAEPRGGTGYGRGISLGCRGGSTTSCGGFGTARVGPDYQAMLRALLAPGLAQCVAQTGADPASASLSLEATADEVVDVQVTAPSADFAACLTEAAWALRLTPAFTQHRTYAVTRLR